MSLSNLMVIGKRLEIAKATAGIPVSGRVVVAGVVIGRTLDGLAKIRRESN